MLTALDWINIGYFGISLYLSVILFQDYIQTSIPDFAIFGAFYISLSIFAAANLGHLLSPSFFFISSIVVESSGSPFLNIIDYICSISGYTFYYLINLYFARGISSRFAMKLRVFNRYIFLLNLFMYIPIVFDYNFFVQVSLSVLILIRYSSFLLVIFVQIAIMKESLEQFKHAQRYYFYSDSIEIAWKVAIWLTITSDTLFVVKFIELWVNYAMSNPLILVNIYYLLPMVAGLLGVAIVMVISFFAPEALLVFRYQIVRAVTLYKVISSPKQNQGNYTSREKIFEYLEKLDNILDLDVLSGEIDREIL